MASPDIDQENQVRAHNEKVERSTRLAIAACQARYGAPEILSYESIDTIMDAHPNFNDARRVLADRREQVVAHIRKMEEVMGKNVSQKAPLTLRENCPMTTDTYDNLINAKLLANLMWYDGPLVALYRAVDGDLYIVSWQDCTDTANIWLWLSINRELAILYLRGEVDLLACIKKAEKMFMATVDLVKNTAENGYTQWSMTCFANLKENDLPEPGCVLTDVADGEHCDTTALIDLLVAERTA